MSDAFYALEQGGNVSMRFIDFLNYKPQKQSKPENIVSDIMKRGGLKFKKR